jgi:arylsulfatase/uncharacterized sulfatase
MAQMLVEFDAYAKRVGVLPMPQGYDSRSQVNRNVRSRLLSNYPWIYGVLGGGLLAIVLSIGLATRWLRRRRRAA